MNFRAVPWGLLFVDAMIVDDFFFKPYHPSMASFLLVMSKSYVQNQEATFHLESWLFKVRGILNFMAYERIPSMDVPES